MTIHPTAIIGSDPEHRDFKPGDEHKGVTIDPSAQINALVTVDAGLKEPTRIAARALVMKAAHLGHDVQIGHDVEIAPHVVLGGHVKVGAGTRIGIGAVVRPFITIGENAQVGAGAVVVSNVPDGEMVVGNPAAPIGRRQHDQLKRRLDDHGERLAEVERSGVGVTSVGHDPSPARTLDWDEI